MTDAWGRLHVEVLEDEIHHHPAVHELHRYVLQAGKLPGASRKELPDEG